MVCFEREIVLLKHSQNKLLMKPIIETARLHIRELLPTDIEGMFDLDSNPEVHQYLGNHPVQIKDEIVGVIGFIRQQYIDYGIGRWAMVDKATNEFIGWTGFKYVTETTNNHVNYYDLGYRLREKYWGKVLQQKREWRVWTMDSINLDIKKYLLQQIVIMKGLITFCASLDLSVWKPLIGTVFHIFGID